MKLSLWVKCLWWIILVAMMTFVLWKRLDLTTAGKSTPFDCVVFLVWVALLLAPIFSEVKIWGVELRQEIRDAKKDIFEQIQSVRAEVSNSINLQTTITNAIPAPPPDELLPFIRAEVDRALRDRISETNITTGISEPQIPVDIQYLFSARYCIEQEVRRITNALLDQKSRTQIQRQVDILVETHSIAPEMRNAIIDVYRICSPAVHGNQVSKEQIDLVKDYAPRLLSVLQQLPELRQD